MARPRRPRAPSAQPRATLSVIFNWPISILAITVLALAFTASELGYRIGRIRPVAESDRDYNMVIGMKATIVGFVAFLLSISFSITSARFHDRSELVLDEANAIGTCYLRAGLLADPARSHIRAALLRYTELRLEHFAHGLDPAVFERTTNGMNASMNELWSVVAEGVAADRPTALVSQIVPAANAVIDLSTTRAWITRYHLPSAVIALLAACIVISGGLIGHSSAEAGRRHLVLWMTLNLLVTLVMYVVLDFDQARRGLIQVDHTCLIQLRDVMRSQASP